MEITESEFIKDSMILEYQQALATAQYQIAVLNGQAKFKDQSIAELEAQIDFMRSPKGPQGPTGSDEHPRSVPKPGPPPSR